LGLRIMNHRAGMLGGALVVRKNSGGGVDVICTVEQTRNPKGRTLDDREIAKAKANATNSDR
jgi:hypothetical protein